MSNSVYIPHQILLSAHNIVKTYPQGSDELRILKNINLQVTNGEAVAIVGASGSGKSTLLHILGTLDRPTEGELFFDGRNTSLMNDDELSLFRNTEMGFVFQFHHLVTEFNTLENVMLPLLIANVPESEAKIKATAKLDQMGLSHRLGHYPNQLSGGELQRVAIARALVRSPKILFADEPTGNLDSVNGRAIQDIFFKLHREERMALVVVTHDLNFASRFGRVLRVQDGVMT